MGLFFTPAASGTMLNLSESELKSIVETAIKTQPDAVPDPDQYAEDAVTDLLKKTPMAGAPMLHVRASAVKSALKTAAKTHPQRVKDPTQYAAAVAEALQHQTPPAEFSWSRFGAAVAMLALLAGFGMWSASRPLVGDKSPLADWSKLFIHSFGIMFGGVAALLTGESVANK